MNFRLVLALISSSITASKAHPTEAKEICHGSVCYPAVFVPTDEFEVVHDDQSIPAGLRVKINMETGKKEARLLLPEELDDHSGSNDLALVPGETVHETSKVAGHKQDSPFPPTRPLQGNDRSDFSNALEILRSKQTCSKDVEDALDTLEDLVHELEFGLKLVEAHDHEVLERLLRLMEVSDTTCRAKAALVLGSALQNNANAIHALPPDIALQPRLLRILSTETDDSTRKMLIYTLSASMAQKSAKKDFQASDGHSVLFRAYFSGSNELQGKIASFIEDHFAQLPEHQNKVTLQQGADYEASLADIEALEKWCNTYQSSLLNPLSSVSAREKLLSAASQIKRSHMDTCNATPDFLGYLAKESLAETTDSTEALIAMARSARSLFGNTKASRKHAAAYV